MDIEDLALGKSEFCMCGVCKSVEFYSVEVSGNEANSLPSALAVLDAKAAAAREIEGVHFVGRIDLAPGQYNLEQVATWEITYDVHITGPASGTDAAELLLSKSVAWTFAADSNVRTTPPFS